MPKTKLMRKDNTILRVLKTRDGKAMVIDCLKKTMPLWIQAEDLNGFEQIEEEDLKLAAHACFKETEELDGESRKIAYQRYTMIAGVLPFLADKDVRCQAIRNAAVVHQKSVQTIRAVLWKYLVFQSIGALAPDPRRKEEVLTLDQKNMRWALNRFFYSTKKHSLPTTYTMMLKEKYCERFK